MEKTNNVKTTEQRKKEKVKPVSPVKARLDRKANDERIVRIIRLSFIAFVSLAIICIAVGIALFVYKPPVATVGGEKVEQYEFQYFLAQAKSTMEVQAGYEEGTATSEFWNSNINGEKAIDVAKNNAMANVREFKIFQIKAKEQGISLTEEDRNNINASLESMTTYATQLGWPDSSTFVRALYGISQGELKKVYESLYFVNALTTQEIDKITVTDEQAQERYNINPGDHEHVTVRHILFMYEGTEMDPRTAEISLALAEDTLARIDAGEDMTMLALELSEDSGLKTNQGEYTFTQNDPYEPAFKDWAFAAAVGDTGIVETGYGYHVMRLENRIEETFDEAKESLVTTIKNEMFEDLVVEWGKDARFDTQLNDKVYQEQM